MDLNNVTMERIRVALNDRNLAKVAVSTGLHENTIRSIAAGKNNNPHMTTYEKLVKYLFGNQE
jgi:hypothetical protein